MASLAADLPSTAHAPIRDDRARVRAWLYMLAALVVLMVAVGGSTRLTGSGLSITEWRPVTGAIPPLTDIGWAAEFAKYRASSQYQNLNQGMSLADFQSIYWWEWGHRQLGRLIGIAFFAPLLVFWWRRAITVRQTLTYLAIGALGGLQAAVGWIMVASGLEPGMVAVAPIKLSLHLLIASVILSLLVWQAVSLQDGDATERPENARAARGAAFLLALVLVQIALGGLVAGAKAGLTYNTWPLMDGRLLPSFETLFPVRPLVENFVDSPALVQLQHRLTAYLLVGLAVLHALALVRFAPRSPAANRAMILAAVSLAQMGLGIATLILVVPLWAGLAHQLLAMGLLTVATVHARLCLPASRAAVGRSPAPVSPARAAASRFAE